MKTIIIHEGKGFYRVTNGRKFVEVLHEPEFIGNEKWIARAEWDRYTYSDPVRTKTKAIAIAREMLK